MSEAEQPKNNYQGIPVTAQKQASKFRIPDCIHEDYCLGAVADESWERRRGVVLQAAEFLRKPW